MPKGLILETQVFFKVMFSSYIGLCIYGESFFFYTKLEKSVAVYVCASYPPVQVGPWEGPMTQTVPVAHHAELYYL